MSLRLKIVVAASVLVLFNLLALIVFGDNGLVELSMLRSRETLLIQQNEIMAKENILLYRTIRRLKNDPVYIETVARNELGMVGQDDVIIIRSGTKGRGE